MTRLVVTADDVGLAPGMTRGALMAHERGIVTACSVAVNGESLDDAVQALRAFPDLDVGAHLVLTEERPLSPVSEVRSLVGADGRFLPGFRALAQRAASGGLRSDEIARELGRQLERLRDRGLDLVHLNGHQHLHVLPVVWRVVRDLAREHAIAYVRIPHEPAPGWGIPRGVELRVLNRLGRAARRTLPAGIAAADATVGIRDAGHLHGSRLARAVASATAEEIAELVCHPGLGGEELARRYAWGYDWDEETAALSAPGLRERLSDQGIALVKASSLTSVN